MVREERNALIAWCAGRGLEFERIEKGCLPYRSPLFEVNALDAQGVINFPLDWRRGDLIVLRKKQNKSFGRPPCPIPSGDWEEIRVVDSRIKVQRGRKIAGALFDGVGNLDVVPSVSSKYIHRQDANVVTSGNRFIQTNRPDEVLDCLAAMKESSLGRIKRSCLGSKVPILMRRIFDLLSKEEREAAQYFRRIHEL
jgi:hypothetical protein